MDVVVAVFGGVAALSNNATERCRRVSHAMRDTRLLRYDDGSGDGNIMLVAVFLGFLGSCETEFNKVRKVDEVTLSKWEYKK